jgi:hypothetical protein
MRKSRTSAVRYYFDAVTNSVIAVTRTGVRVLKEILPGGKQQGRPGKRRGRPSGSKNRTPRTPKPATAAAPNQSRRRIRKTS